MFGAVILLLFAALLPFAFWCYDQRRRFRCLNSLPGPKAYPVIGNILEFGLNPVDKHVNLRRISEQYGPLCRVWIGPARCYILASDPDFLEFIMSSPKHITKARDYNLFKPWLSNGLLVSTGSYWHKRRKIITPTFHFKILEQFVPTISYSADSLITKLSKEAEKGSCDIYPYITSYTLDSICDTSMGVSVNAQENPDSEYLKAIKGICNIMVERSFSFWKMFDNLFQFSLDFNKQKNFLNTIHSFTTSVIEKRRTELLSKIDIGNDEYRDEFGGKRRIAFLDLLLEAKVDGESLNNEQIREEVDTFMFEGYDTTASAICFAMYELARNPDVQEKLMNEYRELFGADRNHQLTLTDLSKMKYSELVIKEALRLYPSVSVYGREITEDTTYNGLVLPKGLQILFHAFYLHRRPDLYKNPDKFYPERFLPDSEDTKHAFAYIPFSAGPRNCIGQKFAINEIKITLYKILTNFELLPAEKKHDVILSIEVILKSANGISIILKKRAD